MTEVGSLVVVVAAGAAAARALLLVLPQIGLDLTGQLEGLPLVEDEDPLPPGVEAGLAVDVARLGSALQQLDLKQTNAVQFDLVFT